MYWRPVASEAVRANSVKVIFSCNSSVFILVLTDIVSIISFKLQMFDSNLEICYIFSY